MGICDVYVYVYVEMGVYKVHIFIEMGACKVYVRI